MVRVAIAMGRWRGELCRQIDYGRGCRRRRLDRRLAYRRVEWRKLVSLVGRVWPLRISSKGPHGRNAPSIDLLSVTMSNGGRGALQSNLS